MPGRKRSVYVAVAAVVLLAVGGYVVFVNGPGLGGGDDAGPELAPTNATVAELRPAVLSAIDDVETYRVNGTTERRFGTPRGPDDPDSLSDPREEVTETTAAVDRPNRSLRVESLQRAEGQTVRVQTWVANETLYAKSPAFQGDPSRFRDDYSATSQWESRKPTNFSARWAALDPLTRQRALLSAANLSVAGVDPETDAYVLRGTVDPEAYERSVRSLSGGFAAADAEYTVTNVTVRYLVDRDGRPLRFEGTVDLTVPTEQGAVPVVQRVTLEYDYDGSVRVTVPDDAPEPSDG